MRASVIADRVLWEGEGAISSRDLLPPDRNASTVGVSSVAAQDDDDSAAEGERREQPIEDHKRRWRFLRRRVVGSRTPGEGLPETPRRRRSDKSPSVDTASDTVTAGTGSEPFKRAAPSPSESVRTRRDGVKGESLMVKQNAVVFNRESAAHTDIEISPHGDEYEEDEASISPSVKHAMTDARFVRKISNLSMGSRDENMVQAADFGDPLTRPLIHLENHVEEGDDFSDDMFEVYSAGSSEAGDIVFSPPTSETLELPSYVEPPPIGMFATHKTIDRPQSAIVGTCHKNEIQRPATIAMRARTCPEVAGVASELNMKPFQTQSPFDTAEQSLDPVLASLKKAGELPTESSKELPVPVRPSRKVSVRTHALINAASMPTRGPIIRPPQRNVSLRTLEQIGEASSSSMDMLSSSLPNMQPVIVAEAAARLTDLTLATSAPPRRGSERGIVAEAAARLTDLTPATNVPQRRGSGREIVAEAASSLTALNPATSAPRRRASGREIVAEAARRADLATSAPPSRRVSGHRIGLEERPPLGVVGPSRKISVRTNALTNPMATRGPIRPPARNVSLRTMNKIGEESSSSSMM